MAIHSYVRPHDYNLRRATKAWLARLSHQERQFRIWFYVDELPAREVDSLIKRIVEEAGGADQSDARYLVALSRQSWRDIGMDRSLGFAPSSGTLIVCQGRSAFIDRVSGMLREERERRRQPGKRRTTLVTGLGGKMWQRGA